ECPSGVVNEETFKQIYAQFFPHGDASMYAHYLFNAFDTAQNGSVKFEWDLLGCGLEDYKQLKGQNLTVFSAGFSCGWTGFLSTAETNRLC
ncbi:hypothetical protein ASZ78_007392, partial [Callipepla squamata]